MKTSIAFIGFMATGKSTIGKRVARRLGKKFIELDSYISEKAGKEIPAIFAEDGEITFREMEINAIKDIYKEKNQVIACGGGAVLNKINIDRLKEEAVIICLTASPEILIQRAGRAKDSRPLLNTSNRQKTIKELLDYRQPYYERAADITIDTSDIDINQAIETVLATLEKHDNFSK